MTPATNVRPVAEVGPRDRRAGTTRDVVTCRQLHPGAAAAFAVIGTPAGSARTTTRSSDPKSNAGAGNNDRLTTARQHPGVTRPEYSPQGGGEPTDQPTHTEQGPRTAVAEPDRDRPPPQIRRRHATDVCRRSLPSHASPPRRCGTMKAMNATTSGYDGRHAISERFRSRRINQPTTAPIVYPGPPHRPPSADLGSRPPAAPATTTLTKAPAVVPIVPASDSRHQAIPLHTASVPPSASDPGPRSGPCRT